MTTTLLRPTATATLDSTEVTVRGGMTTLDAAAVPYVSATLELPLLEEALLDWANPSDVRRVPYEAGDAFGVSRPFDLSLRRRLVSHDAKTVTLYLASDEALLMKYTVLTDDDGAFAHQASLRGVINYVLAKIGAALEPGTADADVTTASTSTNYDDNPHAAVDIAGWGGINLVNLVRQTAATWTANAAQTAFRLYGTAGNSNSYMRRNYTDLAGKRVLFRARHRNGASIASPGADASRLAVYVSTDNGTTLFPVGSMQGSTAANGQADPHVVADIPSNATLVQLRLYHGYANADSVFWSDIMVRDYAGDPTDVAYWDGTTADTARYRYDWKGDVGISTSTRTALLDRNPEMLTWAAGTNAWDFLVAITASVGLVLWCDELRNWYLAAPADRTIVELITVATSTTRNGTDDIDLGDDETTPTGIVIIYRWRDADGVQREAYDSAGTPERGYTLVLNRAYPGPGVAAAMLARRSGSSRRQDVTVISQIGTTPGMTAQITLPGAPDTAGRVASVAFDHGTGFMTLVAAGLIDVMPGSVAALAGTVDALVGTVDSL